MKRKEQSVLLAGLLAMVLAACSSTGMRGSERASTNAGGDTTGVSSYGTGATAGTDTASGASSGSSATGAAGSTTGTMGNMGNMGTGASATGSSGTGGSTAMGDSGQAAAATTGQPGSASGTGGAPNSTVTSIEVVQRQAGGATGAGTVAGAAVGGATVTGDRVYRITLRSDDGRTQVITQEWAPTFSTGDRVRVSSGAIQRQ